MGRQVMQRVSFIFGSPSEKTGVAFYGNARKTAVQFTSAMILELKARCKLKDAGREVRRQPSEVSAVDVEDAQLLRACDSKVRAIENIERLSAKLETCSLGETDVLDKAQVPIDVERAVDKGAL